MTGHSGEPMDANGKIINKFGMTMANLGLHRAAEELVQMLDSGCWRKYVVASQTFEFLPGEFDYFLTSEGIFREHVMGVRNVEALAHLEEAMDERRTGEEGYRRPILQARAEVPQIGRPMEPFGLTKKEAKALFNGTAVGGGGGSRPALGEAVRRWNNTGGSTSRKPGELRPKWERLAASAVRLDDGALDDLYEAVRTERTNRRKNGKKR